ncbi:MAG: hypothetical protein ACLP8S_01285 [Solirubrobacteraceae bacterium]
MTPTAAVLLTAWEAGAAEAPVDRSPSLLRSLGLLPPGATVERLTVGQCDICLLRLRREMFGDRLEAVATCPQCNIEVELAMSVSALEHGLRASEPRPAAVERDGFAVSYRLPLNEDLSALARRADVDRFAELLRRCVLDARGPHGEAVHADELPDALSEAIVEAMAESDPGASVELAVTCECGHEWLEELDIRTLFWADLTDWVGRLLTDVQALARYYGWSEAELLSMPAWRRRWYMEAAGL